MFQKRRPNYRFKKNTLISAKSPLLLPTFLNQRDPVLELVLLPWLPENRKFRSVFETFHPIQKWLFRKETNGKKRGPETCCFFMFFLHFRSIRDMFESWGNFTGTEYLGQPWVAGTHPAVSYAISLVFWTHHKRVDNSWQRIPGVCLLRSTRPVRAKALLRPRVASQTDPNPSMVNLFPPTLILIQSHYTKQNANKT